MSRSTFFIVVLFIFIASGCAGRKTRVARPAPVGASPEPATARTDAGANAQPQPSIVTDDSRPAPPSAAAENSARIGAEERGIASWYGHPYHGRRTSSGETYDMEEMTAAHRTLPFDTWVRVNNLDNGHSTDVRINDRGPFIDGRIIDLSRAAAQRIGMLGPGTAPVRIRIIPPPDDSPGKRTPTDPPLLSSSASRMPFDAKPAASAKRFGVQVGAFREKGAAERAAAEWKRTYPAAQLLFFEDQLAAWKVVLGDFATDREAAEFAGQLRARGADGFVVSLAGSFVSVQ